jgi:hypothetical protein
MMKQGLKLASVGFIVSQNVTAADRNAIHIGHCLQKRRNCRRRNSEDVVNRDRPLSSDCYRPG